MALKNTESGLLTEDDNYMDEQDERAEAFNANYENCTEPEPVKRWAMRDRLRSRVLWVSVIAELVKIAEEIYTWIKYGFTPGGLEVILLAVCMILTIFGILNDPTNREGF